MLTFGSCVHLVHHHVLQFLIEDRAREYVGLQRLAGYAGGVNILRKRGEGEEEKRRRERRRRRRGEKRRGKVEEEDEEEEEEEGEEELMESRRMRRIREEE